jgi:hypothetical protein
MPSPLATGASRVCWLVDTHLTDDRRFETGFPTLIEAAVEAGHRVYQTNYVRGSYASDPGIPFGPKDCVVSYGTHQFIRQIQRARGRQWVPGTYSRIENLGYTATAAHLGDLMLNDDFILLPFGEVVRRGCEAFGDAFFIKPEAVTKAFTGFVMTRANWDIEIKTLREKHVVQDDLLCAVAKPREIEAEFRFVIADRQVVTGSQYRFDDRLDVRLDVLPICEEMAWEVARREWQPDRVYVCDVALLDGRSRARVVELNSFSSSGLYSCDTRAIVSAVSTAAWREYLGGDEL